MFRKIIIIGIGAIMLFGLFGCSRKNKADPGSREGLLLEYTNEITGLPEPDSRGVFTIRLYRISETEACLEVSEGESTGKRSVSPSVADEAYALIEQYKLKSWHELKNFDVLDGRCESCSFRDGDVLIRVSTEHMPPDGEEALHSIRKLLQNRYDEAAE